VIRLIAEKVDIIAPDLESQTTSVKSEPVQKPVVIDILHFSSQLLTDTLLEPAGCCSQASDFSS